MEDKLIEIPNYINGKFEISGEKRILKSYSKKDYALIYNASDGQLREAKRNLIGIKKELNEIPVKKIIAVIKKTMDFYFTSEKEYEHITTLTGSPLSFVKSSFEEMKAWCRNLDQYLSLCFGTENIEKIPIKSRGKILGYKKYIPRGPIIGILPKNSEATSIYLIVQILLSKNPGIVKTSSSLASSYTSIQFMRALHKALDKTHDKSLQLLRRAISIVNLFDNDKRSIINRLEVAQGVYVVFGSNQTIQAIEQELKDSDYRAIIKLGTGLSASLVLADADLTLAAKEICEAASMNNGRDCISTSVLYIMDDIYDKCMKKLRLQAEHYKSNDPLSKKSTVGIIEEDTKKSIHETITRLNRSHLLKKMNNQLHLSFIELDEHEQVYEFPGPIVCVRKISTTEEFVRKLKEDIQKNNMEKNLATSLFTKDKTLVEKLSEQIPSYIVKLNKGTEKMNLMLEHQGRYLLKDFLSSIILENV